MNFDVGDVLTRAWQITWKHKLLWVFNMFPVLLSFPFIPIVLIPMFFIGPNALINQDVVDSPTCVSAFIDGLDYFWHVLGVSVTIGAAISIVFLLPVLALVQGFSLTFMKSAFMIIYLRLTRSTVLQPTSL